MTHKGRPKKVRFIQKMPKIVQFSPRGRPGRPNTVDLTLDQFEALKLADYQGFDQVRGAVVMRISRPSFGRILREARKRIADALVNGKAIKIHMGDVQVGVQAHEFSLKNFKEDVEQFKSRTRKVIEGIKTEAG